jgi:hypothetical protein
VFVNVALAIIVWECVKRIAKTAWAVLVNALTAYYLANNPQKVIDPDEYIGVAPDGRTVIMMRIKSRSAEVVGKIDDQDISRYIRITDGRLFEFEGLLAQDSAGALAREDHTCQYLLIEPGLMYREMVGYK